MAEDDLAVIGPDLEMAHPGTLVDQADQLIGGGPAGLRRLQVQRTAQLQAVALGAPGEPELVILPVAGQRKGQIALVGAVERQVFGHQDVFHDLQRIVGNIDFFGPYNVHQALSGRDSRPVIGR